MQTYPLLDNLTYREPNPIAEPLSVDGQGRVLRFMLQPGQLIREHQVPSSPFFVVVLQGQGVFTGGDGIEQTSGPNTLIVFTPGEKHSVRALDAALVFVGILHGVPEKHAG